MTMLELQISALQLKLQRMQADPLWMPPKWKEVIPEWVDGDWEEFQFYHPKEAHDGFARMIAKRKAHVRLVSKFDRIFKVKSKLESLRLSGRIPG